VWLKSIWIPVSGAIAQQRNVDTIANNVANANTPGFKKDQLIFKEHLTALEKGYDDIQLPNKEWAPKDFYNSHGSQNAYVKVVGNYTDHTQGQLTPTENPLDLAINGKGFFEVLTPNGIRFTRAGNFTLANDGSLVTTSGYPVLSKVDWKQLDIEGGETKIPTPNERTIKIPPGKLSINNLGEIFVNGNKYSDLSINEFNDIHALKKEGQSLFINERAENLSRTDIKASVHQGFVEQSNVNAVSEMSALINANRYFESIQKAIKAYDTITGKGVNEISKF
jgi:flagellar basal-body rod protein FlgG